MASAQTNIDLTSNAMNPTPATTATSSMLVSLVPLSQEAFETTLSNLALAFPNDTVLVATPDTAPQLPPGSPLRLIPYTPTAVSATPWVLTAADYLNTYKLAQENRATSCLLLGAECQSLHPETIRALAQSTLTNDLSVAHYDLGPREGLVNSAILYPVNRALFGTRPRYPSPSTSASPFEWPVDSPPLLNVLLQHHKTTPCSGRSQKQQPPTSPSPR
ncbi:hypothetical protein [Tunturiibacter gelidiferens]|uniref:hypothetical protein n=1 Tax=Tunturiibacter gelidiferens TaxID=3069689 RepID=UPI003D9BE65A